MEKRPIVSRKMEREKLPVLFISKGTVYLLWGFKLEFLYESLFIKSIGSIIRYKESTRFVIYCHAIE